MTSPLKRWLTWIEPPLEKLETEYRQHYLRQDIRQAMIVGMIFIIGDLALLISDYALFSQSEMFFDLLITRAVLGGATLGFIGILGRLTQPNIYDRFVFGCTLFVSIMSILIDSTRPSDFLGRFMIYLVLVFAIYLVLPNTLSARVLAALFVSGASITSMFSLTERNAEIFAIVSVVCLVAANMVGIYASARYYTVRRQQYQALQEAQTLNEKLTVLAEVDSLTGAFNRRKFFELGAYEFARFKRYQSPLSVAILDLDFFKRINDTHGHPVGDQTLKIFATTVMREIRATDRFGRLGGEEFGLLLTETVEGAAVKVAERIRQHICDSDTLRMLLGQALTTSIGVCSAQNDDTTFDDLVRRADHALYQAKSEGRNRVIAEL